MERKKKRQKRKLEVYQQITTLLLLVIFLGIIIEIFFRAEERPTFTYLARIYVCIMLVCVQVMIYLDTLINTDRVVTHKIISKENWHTCYTHTIAKDIILLSLILIVMLLIPFTCFVWWIIVCFLGIILAISIAIYLLMEKENKV